MTDEVVVTVVATTGCIVVATGTCNRYVAFCIDVAGMGCTAVCATVVVLCNAGAEGVG